MSKLHIFVILGILFLLEIVGATYYLSRPLPVPQPVPPEETVSGAVLTLTPDTGEIRASESTFIKISLDTGGQAVDGARAVLLYDPSQIAIEDINHNIAIFSTYPVQEINNEQGRVVVTGIITPDEPPFQGSGTLATLQVKALQPGTALLNFEFIPGQTTDSNVALHGAGEDILQRASEGVYSVVGE